MIWLYTALLLAIVLFFLLEPFLRKNGLSPVSYASFRPTYRRRNLKEQKASYLLALRELDFDFEMGKLSAEDYKSTRAQYQTKTVDVMKELEREDEEWKKVQEAIDKEVEKRTKTIVFCASCGRPMRKKEDRFCGECGAPVKASAYA